MCSKMLALVVGWGQKGNEVGGPSWGEEFLPRADAHFLGGFSSLLRITSFAFKKNKE